MVNDEMTDEALLRRQREELLALLSEEEGLALSETQRIAPREERGEAPLSFAQQRLWFLEELLPGSPVYHIVRTVRLGGQLDVRALQQALDAIVARHEALRTTFAAVDGSPRQFIASSVSVALPTVDLSEWPRGTVQAEVERRLQEEARRPFRLSHDPMLRALLLRLAPDEHVFLLVMHHIASDGWSRGVLFRELSALYAAFSAGRASPLPELPIQYADFAVWQRSFLQGPRLESQLSYWRQQLAGAPAVLELPTDRPRPAVQSGRGARHCLQLPEPLCAALSAFSARERVTLFMTLLAAFTTLLHRYTGQVDLVVGSPTANRTRMEIEGLIGFFVNSLALRTDLTGDPTFRELLGRVRAVCLDAYTHQDLPFEKLVEELQPERNMSHSPLFQVMFVLQNTPSSAMELPGLTLSPLEMDPGTAKFDLTLAVQTRESGLQAMLEYSTDLFEPATAARMLEHWQTLLAGIVADPDQCLSRLPLLTSSERHRLLVEWNDTRVDYPLDRCLHHWVDAQAARTPDAPAVRFEGRELTYRELNARANRLAHYLRRLGAGPETRVAICAERSLELVIGLLGTLKAGAAYVPLDPDYPPERLHFMLDEIQAPVLLTQARLLPRLPGGSADQADPPAVHSHPPAGDSTIVCLDTDWEAIARESDADLDSGATADNAAYVIYTSGSTGSPKGAINTHRGICNRLLWMQDTYRLSPTDRVLQKTPYGFDVSVWEFFWPLLAGSCLVLARPGGHRDADHLVELIVREQITTLHFVPSMLRVFLRTEGLERCQSLRQVICSGEVLSPDLQERFFEHLDAELHNLYGPTEAAIDVTSWACERGSGRRTVPIGRPIANTAIYVLDPHLQPVPVGVAGELYIGGVGLARGYLNRPELTQEKFIPHPFHAGSGERLYRTGDRARYLPDGAIEYLGRSDHQVKLRGFRIELEEIEAILSQHPRVGQAVVAVQGDRSAATPGSGDQRLVAYVVTDGQGTVTSDARDQDDTPPRLPVHAPLTADLRQYLQSKLPEYMVPSVFVFLEKLPLTTSGKVDRKSLPAPDGRRPELERTFAPPRTPAEQTLAGIWAQVLRIDRAGIHDNFFELGGDSILSIQVIARARQMGLQITPRQLYQHQTIAKLAAVAGTSPVTAAEQGLVTGPVPLTPIQHWFFEQDLPAPHHFNQWVLLELRQPLDSALVARALEHLLSHHDALRLRYEVGTSGWRQTMAAPDEVVPFTRVDLSTLAASAQGPAMEKAVAELQASLDLTAGPLARLVLFDGGSHGPSRLLFLVHHLAVDGVSWRILLEDLQAAYQQLWQSEPVQLPPKTTSFQHWAERLAEFGRSEALRQELEYWLNQPWARAAPLPVDHPEGAHRVTSASKVSAALTAEETRALLQEVPEAYHTQINDVLLTALAQSFASWTGSRSLLVDLEGHGREGIFEDIDHSRTVGWFTTLFPVLLELPLAADPGLALTSVKEQLRAVPRRGIGYGLLRYAGGDPEVRTKLESLPQAEVSFNYLGQFDSVSSATSLFALSDHGLRLDRGEQGARTYRLAVNGIIQEERLRFDWAYSEDLHCRATIERLSEAFIDALRSLITHCRAPESGGYTPSDFPRAKLSQTELDRLMSRIDPSGRRSLA
jgi:amino acid adenylation domain-containing protein/non-ribosomal peptide synthase protein (TIGR01720 family)